MLMVAFFNNPSSKTKANSERNYKVVSATLSPRTLELLKEVQDYYGLENRSAMLTYMITQCYTNLKNTQGLAGIHEAMELAKKHPEQVNNGELKLPLNNV